MITISGVLSAFDFFFDNVSLTLVSTTFVSGWVFLRFTHPLAQVVLTVFGAGGTEWVRRKLKLEL